MPDIIVDREEQRPRLKQFQPVLDVVGLSQELFRDLLIKARDSGGMTRERYIRYLSMQYHLTLDVQRHFLRAAAHPCLARRKKLRDFLYEFALEEEPHFQVAFDDLARLEAEPLPIPFDVELWRSYFYPLVESRPFLRLGATCVLESLGQGVGHLGRQLLAEAPFLNKTNTRFLEIHFHEALPHGAQIVDAMTSVPLSDQEIRDCVEGAVKGAIFYLRFAKWVFRSDSMEDRLLRHLDP